MHKQREIEPELLKQMEKRQVTTLLGTRRIGKTFLLKRLRKLTPCKNLFIDLDIYENRKIFGSLSYF